MLYEQLLFSELRLAAVSFDTAPLCEENLIKAMTVNEELLALGYTLAPKDIVVLAKSDGLTGFADRIRSDIGDVKAAPMYPDFPSQVMETDEAVFRFHQLLHYLSTYGVEEITGMPVTRGWLPDMQQTEKLEPDDTLLSAKTLALIDRSEQYITPYRRIMTKTERVTDKELMMIRECAEQLPAEALAGVTVTFKQNLLPVFQSIFADGVLSSAQKLICLHAICQHTGDVWKCMDYALTRTRFHFRTSQKRLIVKLLESYPIGDFRENLVISGKKRERTILMLQYLDFNMYSRKPEYAAAVAELRAGRLRSWESQVKRMVAEKAPEVLEVYAARPGMMLRHLTYLMRNGYSLTDIFSAIAPNAARLKTQTLVSLVSFFSRDEANELPESRYQEAVQLRLMLRQLLRLRLSANETPLKQKKVCIRMPEYDLSLSTVSTGDKSSEGGYIRSGIAYRIPENARYIRFFVYWNDKERVDVDLHGAAFSTEGEEIDIGWNAKFKSGELVFSGDITHSDAAEYIDLDLETAKKTLRHVSLNINLYSGHDSFREIDECFVGIMAVSKTGTDIKLYDPKNCFFTHYLTGDYRTLNYGYIDVQNRVLIFDGKPDPSRSYYGTAPRNNAFSLREYLEILFAAQGAEAVSEPGQADVILVMGKPAAENELSLIDSNFFMESE
ncbi:MAG: hypothetical protein IJ060_07895 [Oscillospiraceae bacterium]|nr:hypothetical protein [Oscillospiraceae bacterium]